MTTGERIRQRRKELQISADDLASKIGIDRSTVYRYENGDIEKLPMSVLESLSGVLHTTVQYLMGWEDDTQSNVSGISNIFPISRQRIPLLGSIACGEPIYAAEDRESYIECGTNIKADFCLRAEGDSMIGARIQDGDIVFIRSQPIVDNGEIAAVMIDDSATLKRVYYDRKAQKLVLSAENPKYAPLVYIGEELEQVRILGKAIAFQSDVI